MECADILNNHFHRQFNSGHQLQKLPKSHANGRTTHIEIKGVKKLLADLKNAKALGPNQLRKADLTIDTHLTAECLNQIYNKSLQHSELPDSWKTANVTPIFKSSDRSAANYYRPISLTSIPCKLLEHIVLGILLGKIYGFLHSRQHGFRKGLSCETQLCATMHDILSAANKDLSTHAAVLDFTKAFDKVPHALFMEKLSRIGTIDTHILHRHLNVPDHHKPAGHSPFSAYCLHTT